MSEEGLRILAEFVGAVFLVYITHYLTKSHYESQRKDAIDDRDFNRRAVVYDRQIQEAREYVDKWKDLISIVNDINSKALNATSVNGIPKILDMEGSNQLDLLLQEVNKQAGILHILNDEELLVWHTKFVPILLPMIRYLFDSLRRMYLSNVFDIDKNKLIALSKLCTESAFALVRMKYKLDELAKTYK